MVGAVAGSPGQFPSTWSSTNGGLTRTVVAIGVENGLQYIDVRFNGTTTGANVDIGLESTSSISATSGQNWTQSVYFKTIASQPNSFQLHQFEYNNVGGFVTQANQSFTPNSTLQRFTWSRAIAGATTAFVYPFVRLNVTNGATYDFTIRIAAPQMELGATASTFIPTTTAAVTRLADAASKTGVSSLINSPEGVLFAELRPLLPVPSLGVGYSLSNGTNNELIFMQFTSTASRLTLSVVNSNGANFNANIDGVNFSIFNKIAIQWKQDDFNVYINGVSVYTNLSFNTFSASSLSQIKFERGDGPRDFEGYINQAALFPTRLTPAQLVDLTGGRIYYNPVEAYSAYYLTPEIPSAVITSVNSFF
jgi:hypothetical protein